MLKTFFGCSAVAAAALLVGSLSAQAHDGRDDLCGGVMEADADMVTTSSGKPLLLGSSEPCPAAEQVAAVETETTDAGDADAAAVPASLPHDGMVYFSLDSDQLDAEDQAMLDDIVAAVASQGPASVTVMGHADRSGGDDYNMDLSERRAKTIADALVAAGIPEAAISTMGYGETEPAVATEDGVAMRQNRRAAIETQ
ncbi:MAG: OmpA family protein [Pseudomonadota bacterium]